MSGRDMGRIMIRKPPEAGANLSISGKDIEVESTLSKSEYLSGRSFLGTGKKPSSSPLLKLPQARQTATSVSSIRPFSTLSSPVPSIGKGGKVRPQSKDDKSASGKIDNLTASKSLPIYHAFKNPLRDNTVLPETPSTQPIPRHDPTKPGALVMKRPSSAPKGKVIVDVVVDPILSRHLREHQREGVCFLYECVMGLREFNGEGAILADEMGLGKTLQTITLLWTLLKQNPIHEAPPVVKKALVVCPVTLINNWRKEFKKWLGNERIGVFVFDDKKKRITDFTMGKAYNVMIVGYEKLRTVQEELTKGVGLDIVIADEGHRLKTIQNKSGQAIQSLGATKRIILSGTPIQNDLSEFFAAVDLVNPGVLGTYKNFMREFEGPIVRSRQPEATRRDVEKGEARNEELRELTSLFILRRTAEILTKYLPPKTEYVLLCNPTPLQAKIYRHVLASQIFQTALGNTEGAFHLIAVLKKLCNSPSLINTKTGSSDGQSPMIAALLSSLPPNLLSHFSPSHSGKVQVLRELLEHLRTTTSEKIVLVSNYTSTLNLLASLLTSLSLPFLRLDGSTSASKRQSLVDDFNRTSSKNCFAFLLSAKAGGTGLNLIGASRLILFDIDWNPATDMQAMARIHRDGQKRHCWIYRLMIKGSIEEKIWQRQVTKIGLADSVIDQKRSVAQFSHDELKDLFRLDEGDNCQTHELLHCSCGERGRVVNGNTTFTTDKTNGVDMGFPPPSSEHEDFIKPFYQESSFEFDDDDDEADGYICDFPSLIKASKLDMETQEQAICSGAHPLQRHYSEIKGKKNSKSMLNSTLTRSPPSNNKRIKSIQDGNLQQFLSQYAHINPSLFLLKSTPTQSSPITTSDSECEIERISNLGDKSEDKNVTDSIQDHILLSLLKASGTHDTGSVGFVFAKTMFGNGSS